MKLKQTQTGQTSDLYDLIDPIRVQSYSGFWIYLNFGGFSLSFDTTSYGYN